jgi:hypothetical protein
VNNQCQRQQALDEPAGLKEALALAGKGVPGEMTVNAKKRPSA